MLKLKEKRVPRPPRETRRSMLKPPLRFGNGPKWWEVFRIVGKKTFATGPSQFLHIFKGGGEKASYVTQTKKKGGPDCRQKKKMKILIYKEFLPCN